MNPIPATPTRLISDVRRLGIITRIEIALRFIEESAGSATNSINSFAIETLRRADFIAEYYPQKHIKLLAKTIRKLSSKQRHDGNRFYNWDNRFNKIHKPAKCGIRRITLRPCARHSLRAGKGTSETRAINSEREIVSWRDFLDKLKERQLGTPIDSDGPR